HFGHVRYLARDVAGPVLVGAEDEAGDQFVEWRAEPLHRVARAWEDGTLGAESFLEHIADRVERGAVCARDDELRERRPRKVVEREGGLCRRALDHQRPRALQQLRRELSGRSRGADESEEPPEELARIARSLAPVPIDP